MQASSTLSMPIEQSEQNLTPTSGKRVMVVDDNEAAAKGLGKLLTLKGHTVALAHTGSDAIAQAAAFNPDAMLLDIGLPDTDGYAVARELRASGVTSVLIALTGYGQFEDKQNALDAGFNYHFTKPVGIKDIESVLPG